MSLPGFELDAPHPAIRFGPGRVHELRGELDRLGGRRPLVVCSWRRRRSEAFGHLAGGLGLTPPVFAQVEEHVPRPIVEAAWAAVLEHDADVVVSFGGGAAIDLGKALVALAVGGREGRALGHVAVPTTYSGAEATGRAWVSEGQVKQPLVASVRPDAAVLDPALTLDLPWKPTASTGMTAVANAVEALIRPTTEHPGPAWAERCVRILASRLPQAVADPASMVVREELLAASFAAGAALGRLQVGLREALACGLGGRAGVPHGMASAILLPHVVRRLQSAGASLELVAQGLGAAVEGAADALESLARRLGLPRRLREVGVFEEDLDMVAAGPAGAGLGVLGGGSPSVGDVVAILR